MPAKVAQLECLALGSSLNRRVLSPNAAN